MADIRIKDLTTTASSTASDDFIAVDGTTNGTRKLNAFSPTFGGNATVTGTLTVNGVATASAGIVIGEGTFGAGKIYTGATGGLSLGAKTGSSYDFILATPSGANLIAYVPTGTDRLVVPSTTASTSTSTGALVVGNGTSGGLGVGGAASIGGPILVGTSSDVYLSRVGAGILDIRSASSPGTAARLDVTGTTSAGLGLRQTGTRDWFISAESSELRVSCLTAASIFAFNSGTPVAMRDTTSSTSTSSGALVVSGGVGVAGAVNVGGNLGVTGTITVSGDQNSFFSGSWPRMFFETNGSSKWISGATTGASTVQHDFQNRSTTSLLTLYGTGNAIFAGNIKTAAPVGGTAAEWKLGTVATVSPTSPNRTIEVDIGGTIYYIHAKTTNN